MNPTPFYPLIDARTLIDQIQDPNLRVFDCRFSLAEPELGSRVYREGHIPGAYYANLDTHLSSPIGPETGRHPLPDPVRLADWLGQCGVTSDTRVVVYDDLGGTFAGRLWWLLRWLGHSQVAMLDGGLTAWTEAGGDLSTETPTADAGVFTAAPEDTAWITSDALVAALAAETVRIIDARAPERFSGEVETTDSVGGHISGAINLPLTGNLGPDGHFLPPEELRQRFLSAIGDVPPNRVVHSCGSGVTACHNLLAMEVAGLAGSRLYVGSWSEWIRSPERPVATGL